MPEVIDLVETELAVQVEEYDAAPDGQVRMRFQVPQVKQILIVQ